MITLLLSHPVKQCRLKLLYKIYPYCAYVSTKQHTDKSHEDIQNQRTFIDEVLGVLILNSNIRLYTI